MARKRSESEEEHITVVGNSAPEDVDVTTAFVHGGAIVADAVAARATTAVPTAEIRKARRFVVRKGGMISATGYRTMMREGKEIDDLNYDIRSLAQQGILLEEVLEVKSMPIPAGY